jgi:hypothetical protein
MTYDRRTAGESSLESLLEGAKENLAKYRATGDPKLIRIGENMVKGLEEAIRKAKK